MKEMTKQRNADFVRRCLEIYEHEKSLGKNPELDEVLFRAMASSPKVYYVNFDTASRQLHRIRRHGISVIKGSPGVKKMWSELNTYIEEVLEKEPRKKFDSALSYVLNFRRPSRFYINLDTARKIIRPYITYSITYKPF